MIDNICQRLEALGANANDVAKKLSKMGFRGQKNSATFCPVARYLEAKTPYRVGLMKIDSKIVIGALDAEHGFWAEFEAPRPIQHFVGRFDVGLFPDLDIERIQS